jgi:TolB-like protein/DNA-binding winged helix-turn-helix (wHTH) protein/Flp pilus assembly protein TadD
LRFGEFEADLRSGELRRRGLKVKLADQSFQVLALLLENPGQVVTREELQQKLWAQDTFVDFEAGLNSAIKRLRDALGDSADEPRFIETLPRRGYRFLVPVQVDGHAAPAEAAVAPAPLPGAAWKKPAVAAPALVVLVVAAVLGFNVGGLRHRLFRGSPRIQSLAVLPLENLTGDPAQDYLVDGMTDALTTNLAQAGALRVISRTSAMQYKGTRKPLRQIAKELDVDAVVEGSVARSGSRVRINAQLVEAASDRHLWAASYERDAENILALQNEVARAIAKEIEVKLTPDEHARLARARPVNPAAYEALLKGRYTCTKRTEAAMKKGIEFFEQAIALQPDYAQAYAELSDCYRLIQFFGSGAPEEYWLKAKAAAEKALELDDSLAEAHTSLAVLLWRHDWNWATSEAEFRRALQLNPNYVEGRRAYSVYLRTVGRFQEALAESRRARDLDPLSPTLRSDLALLFYWWRKYGPAVEEARKTLEIEPSHAQTHYVLGRSYAQMKEFPKAVAELEQAISLSGGNPAYVTALGYTYALAGDKKQARKALEELRQTSRRRYVPPYGLAAIYAGLGEKDAAFAELEKAYAERSFLFPVLHLDPQFDSLRSDPRFADLVRRLNLPASATAHLSGGRPGQPAGTGKK